METRLENRSSWRAYQNRLKRRNGNRRLRLRLRWMICAVAGLMALCMVVRVCLKHVGAVTADRAKLRQSQPTDSATHAPAVEMRKSDIRAWLPSESVVNLEKKRFDVQVSKTRYRVETSLDLPLQKALLKKVHRSNAKLLGLVVLRPGDGKVLAMVSVDKDHPASNPCLDKSFPAASVFKIVTAAAAIEKCHFEPDTELNFNGGRYTLYKSQLKNRVNRYTNTITFRDSFAQSVDPVFGKIGSRYVGRGALEKYAEAFGFNRKIDFEVRVQQSFLEVPTGRYHLAEIACGFNRTTTLTPLHGALIVAAVLDGGRLPEPTMIDEITDENGRAVYRSKPSTVDDAISARTGEIIGRMMTRTIRYGTCRRVFRGASRDRVLSRLVIGGKTGTIDNKDHSRRMDWFVGYAREKHSGETIAVGIVVGHGKYMGTRASEFARYVFKDYFKTYFAAAEAEEKHEKG